MRKVGYERKTRFKTKKSRNYLGIKIIFVILRTDNKQRQGWRKKVFRRSGATCPFCQGHGPSGAHSHTPISRFTEMLLLWRYPRRASYRKSYGIPTSERTQRCRTHPRRDRNTQSEILHQQRQLGNGKKNVCRFPRATDLQERELLQVSSFFNKEYVRCFANN